jgi:hypothetical protein
MSFQDLTPLLEWALPSEHERRAKRAHSTMAEIKSFYETMLARMEDILTYLGRFPAENPPADVQRLFLLTAALAEIAPAVEMYGEQTAEGLDVLRLKSVDIYPARNAREIPLRGVQS